MKFNDLYCFVIERSFWNNATMWTLLPFMWKFPKTGVLSSPVQQLYEIVENCFVWIPLPGLI